MTHLKKLIVAAMAVVTAVALCVPALAFAAGTGSITITPPTGVDTSETITYKIYKVFDADGNGTAISYKIASGKTDVPAGFQVDEAGNVTYATDPAPAELTQADIEAIAAYVAGDDPVATVTSTGGADAVAENLPNGYYYITTTTGTVVTIDSTNPNAEVEDKNDIPGPPKKKIGEDFDGYVDEAGKNAIAQVGKTVPFKVEIEVLASAKGYVFHDVMSDGLSLNENSLTVTPAASVDSTTPATGDTITVTFKDEWLAENAGETITIEYSATVTSDALSIDYAHNTATLSYGDGHKTEMDQVKVYNAKFTVTKNQTVEEDTEGAVYNETDGKYYLPLAGAGFIVKNSEGKYYTLANNKIVWVDSEDDADVHSSDADGAVPPFTGLETGDYTLIEKVVPAGYNKAADYDFTIEEDFSPENLDQQGTTVTNNSGAELPSTGGIGTTIFYVIGAILVIGAGVVLITKRRVAAARKDEDLL